MPEFPIENGGHETWPPSSPPIVSGDPSERNHLMPDGACLILLLSKKSPFIPLCQRGSEPPWAQHEKGGGPHRIRTCSSNA
jgi:hypothetical protein